MPSNMVNRGVKWTSEEETFLVVNSMYGYSNGWIHRHLPGGNNRTANAISGHFGDMRMRGRLSTNWRAKNWNNERPYAVEEDAEIIIWHVWGRKAIDPKVFVGFGRAGGSVVDRADYLSQDEELVEEVRYIEERLRQLILEHDLVQDAGQGDDMDCVLRRTAIQLRYEEECGLYHIQHRVLESLALRATDNAEGMSMASDSSSETE